MTQLNPNESNSTNINNTNDPGHTMGIVGFVLAFVGVTPLGLTLSIIAYKKSKSVGIKNKLALAGIWLNAIFFVITAFVVAAIFSVTFLALPALQTSQRDTQRKNDTVQITTAITSYASNHRGSLPSDSEITDGTFVSNYITMGYDNWQSPSGEEYSMELSGKSDVDKFIFNRGENCDGVTGEHEASVRIMLESGSEYCQSY